MSRASGKALSCLRSLINLTLLVRALFTFMCSSYLTVQGLISGESISLPVGLNFCLGFTSEVQPASDVFQPLTWDVAAQGSSLFPSVSGGLTNLAWISVLPVPPHSRVPFRLPMFILLRLSLPVLVVLIWLCLFHRVLDQMNSHEGFWGSLGLLSWGWSLETWVCTVFSAS